MTTRHTHDYLLQNAIGQGRVYLTKSAIMHVFDISEVTVRHAIYDGRAGDVLTINIGQTVNIINLGDVLRIWGKRWDGPQRRIGSPSFEDVFSTWPAARQKAFENIQDNASLMFLPPRHDGDEYQATVVLHTWQILAVYS